MIFGGLVIGKKRKDTLADSSAVQRRSRRVEARLAAAALRKATAIPMP
jgi:hypothetical protein